MTTPMPLEEATGLAYRRLVSVASNARQVNPAMEELARRLLTTGLFEAADLLDRAAPALDALVASQVRMVVAVLRCLERRSASALLHEVALTADALAYASEALRHDDRQPRAALCLYTSLGPGPSVYRDAAEAAGWPPMRAFACASLETLMAATQCDAAEALDMCVTLEVDPSDRPCAWAHEHLCETLTWLGSLSEAQIETACVLARSWSGTLGQLHRASRALA